MTDRARDALLAEYVRRLGQFGLDSPEIARRHGLDEDAVRTDDGDGTTVDRGALSRRLESETVAELTERALSVLADSSRGTRLAASVDREVAAAALGAAVEPFGWTLSVQSVEDGGAEVVLQQPGAADRRRSVDREAGVEDVRPALVGAVAELLPEDLTVVRLADPPDGDDWRLVVLRRDRLAALREAHGARVEWAGQPLLAPHQPGAPARDDGDRERELAEAAGDAFAEAFGSGPKTTVSGRPLDDAVAAASDVDAETGDDRVREPFERVLSNDDGPPESSETDPGGSIGGGPKRVVSSRSVEDVFAELESDDDEPDDADDGRPADPADPAETTDDVRDGLQRPDAGATDAPRDEATDDRGRATDDCGDVAGDRGEDALETATADDVSGTPIDGGVGATDEEGGTTPERAENETDGDVAGEVGPAATDDDPDATDATEEARTDDDPADADATGEPDAGTHPADDDPTPEDLIVDAETGAVLGGGDATSVGNEDGATANTRADAGEPADAATTAGDQVSSDEKSTGSATGSGERRPGDATPAGEKAPGETRPIGDIDLSLDDVDEVSVPDQDGDVAARTDATGGPTRAGSPDGAKPSGNEGGTAGDAPSVVDAGSNDGDDAGVDDSRGVLGRLRAFVGRLF